MRRIDPYAGRGASRLPWDTATRPARELQNAFTHNAFLVPKGIAARVLAHRAGRYMRRRANMAWLIYAVRSRLLLRFLGMSVGPLVGWAARHFLVDWGE